MGKLTYTDHGGPFVPSTKGFRGYTIYTNDFSDVVQMYIWKNNLEYTDALEDYRVWLQLLGRHRGLECDHREELEEVVYNVEMLTLHSKNDTTIVKGKAEAYCEKHGITQRTGSPYLHENNSRAKVLNKLIQARARAMLLTAGLPATMWPLSMMHSAYVVNRTPKAGMAVASSYGKLGWPPRLDELRIFGSTAHAFVDPKLRTELQDRATRLIYVGHDETSTAYLLYSSEREKIVRSGMIKQFRAGEDCTVRNGQVR
ncbi:hypothetical protein CYMTET_34016 [Cymbomonas tetramitiformis]|uniref:Retroviral polymerase SH3-like domain-containing protein n=1 Tax=Cymbomonas tetramitiformis TaxID=36881 RepID=A0AAE0FCG5_9CHLO|nr:hypothetical protein CYMTET_34016 [Cymbomonas tetramitiformis]